MSERPSPFFFPGHYLIAAGDMLEQKPEDIVGSVGLRTIASSSSVADLYAGLSIKIKWKHMEPTKGNYVLSALEQYVLDPVARANSDSPKKVCVEIHDRTFNATNATTHYPGPSDRKSLWFNGGGQFLNQKHWMPKEYEPEYYDMFCAFFDALGARYQNDERIAAIVMNEFHVVGAHEIKNAQGKTYIDANRDVWIANKKGMYAAVAGAFPRHVVYQAANHPERSLYMDTTQNQRELRFSTCEDIIRELITTHKGGLTVPDAISRGKIPNSPNNCFDNEELEIYTDYPFASRFFSDASLIGKVPFAPQAQLPSTRTYREILNNSTNRSRLKPAARDMDAPEAHLVHCLESTGVQMFFWATGGALDTSAAGKACKGLQWNMSNVSAMLRARKNANKPLVTPGIPTNISSRGDVPVPVRYEAPANVSVAEGRITWTHSGTRLKAFRLEVANGKKVFIGRAVRYLSLERLGLSGENFTANIFAIKNDNTESAGVLIQATISTVEEPATLCASSSDIVWTFEGSSTPVGFEVILDDQVRAVTAAETRSVSLPAGLSSGSHTVVVKTRYRTRKSPGKSLTWTHPSASSTCREDPPDETCDIKDPVCVRPLYEGESSLTTTPAEPRCQAGFYTAHRGFVTATASVASTKKVAFIGDSITARWLATANGDQNGGLTTWTRHFDSLAMNFGRGGDKVQGVAWRMRAGWANQNNMKQFSHPSLKNADNSYFRNWTPKVLVLMIGTNNIGSGWFPASNGAQKVRNGIWNIATYFTTTINPNGVALIMHVPPAKGAGMFNNARAINQLLYGPIHEGGFVPVEMDDIRPGSIYTFPTWALLTSGDAFNPTFNQNYFVSDGVHVNATGYARLAEGYGSGDNKVEGLAAVITRLLGAL